MEVKANQLVKGSMFLAFGIILPYIFHTTGMAGNVFLPMHIPILLCGFMLGKKYGLIVGIITPFLNSILTGMPPLYPVGVSMALELGAYGFTSGYLYKHKRYSIILSLLISMIIGRLISGLVNFLLLFAGGKEYLLSMFIASALIKPIWGIIIQLILIPVIIKVMEKNKGKMI